MGHISEDSELKKKVLIYFFMIVTTLNIDFIRCHLCTVLNSHKLLINTKKIKKRKLVLVMKSKEDNVGPS